MFGFFFHYRKNHLIIVEVLFTYVLLCRVFFPSLTNTDLCMHHHISVGRVAGSSAPDAAKQPGVVNDVDLSHVWYRKPQHDHSQDCYYGKVLCSAPIQNCGLLSCLH